MSRRISKLDSSSNPWSRASTDHSIAALVGANSAPKIAPSGHPQHGALRQHRLIVAFLLLFVGLAAPLRAAEPLELDVMSFNVRYARPGHSERSTDNNWNDSRHPRRERAIRVVRENLPDVLGVQEAMSGQIKDLKTALPEFEFYGVGRDDGKTAGEYAGIFYRRDRFEPVDSGSFWLSATPENPGTTFSSTPNAVPRVASWVKLKDRAADQEFLILNAHWDHIDKAARRQSARLIRDRLAKLADGVPAIVMGDFNAREDSPALSEITQHGESTGLQLVDSYRMIHPERAPDEASYGNFEGTTDGSRIDFILASPEWKPTAAAIVRRSYDGLWPSDHYPVTATLSLAPKQ